MTIYSTARRLILCVAAIVALASMRADAAGGPPVPVASAGIASPAGVPMQNLDGSPVMGTNPATGLTAPPVGTGGIGWLASVYNLLNGGIKVTNQGQSGTLAPCQGGGNSAVSSVGTTATQVCAAGTARAYWRVANNAPSGGTYVYCTDDGSTVTLTHWTFVAYPQGFQDSAGMQVLSIAAISCIASATTPVAALASQTGAP